MVFLQPCVASSWAQLSGLHPGGHTSGGIYIPCRGAPHTWSRVACCSRWQYVRWSCCAFCKVDIVDSPP
eukprot:7431854-Ditylum_brightwellii.AAC.1